MKKTTLQQYNGVTDRKGFETNIDDVINQIKTSGRLKEQIHGLRVTLEEWWELDAREETERAIRKKENAEAQKKTLPAVTWSGTFKERSAKKMTRYTNLLCIDIDKLNAIPDYNSVWRKLTTDPYTFLCFNSPSGNGIKAVIKVSGGVADHLKNFTNLEKYYKDVHDITIDPSGKDVSRLCFLSHDPDLFINWDCRVFDWVAPVTSEVVIKPLTAKEKRTLQDAEPNFEWLRGFTDKKLIYADGSRNNYLYLFSCNANRKGFDINDTLNYALAAFGDLKQDEVVASIRSAYTHNIADHGTYAKKTPGEIQSIPAKSGVQNSGNDIPAATEQEIKEFVKFWYVTEDEKRTDEEGKPLKKYNVVYNKLILFLESAGFYRLPLTNGSYQFIRINNNVVEPIGLINMKDYVFSFLKNLNEMGVLEMMRRGAKSYFIPQIMEGLEYKTVEFGKDTATEAFFYFRNCIARVTADGVTTHMYSDEQRAIWASSMIQRDFVYQKPDYPAKEGRFDLAKWKCDMARYIALVSHNPKSTEDITPEECTGRFLSICSSIGYMLHGWKSRIGKAVIAVDHKIPEDKTEQNGGTGKSIVGDSFKYLKSTSIIDGREFKEDYNFRFEMIGVDTKVVIMQDCRYNLDFGSFFVPITNDFTYNRRHTGYITMPYADSPKWWFDTNFVFRGEGASFRRRMHVIEFDDYFDENHNPYDEFGHFLFQDWNADQWNMFYNFYLDCVALYLKDGLIDYPKSNYENRKLMVEAPQEFIDFLDAAHESGVLKTKRNEWFSKKDLLQRWNTEARELSMTVSSPHQLTKWMKKFCNAKNVRLLKDKTNGVEWWLLADQDYKGAGRRSEKANVVPQQTLL